MLVDELLDVDVGLGATRKSGILNYHHIPAGNVLCRTGRAALHCVQLQEGKISK